MIEMLSIKHLKCTREHQCHRSYFQASSRQRVSSVMGRLISIEVFDIMTERLHLIRGTSAVLNDDSREHFVMVGSSAE